LVYVYDFGRDCRTFLQIKFSTLDKPLGSVNIKVSSKNHPGASLEASPGFLFYMKSIMGILEDLEDFIEMVEE